MVYCLYITIIIKRGNIMIISTNKANNKSNTINYSRQYYALSGIKLDFLSEEDFEYFKPYAANQKAYHMLTGKKLSIYDMITDIEIAYLQGSDDYKNYFNEVFLKGKNESKVEFSFTNEIEFA